MHTQTVKRTKKLVSLASSSQNKKREKKPFKFNDEQIVFQQFSKRFCFPFFHSFTVPLSVQVVFRKKRSSALNKFINATRLYLKIHLTGSKCGGEKNKNDSKLHDTQIRRNISITIFVTKFFQFNIIDFFFSSRRKLLINSKLLLTLISSQSKLIALVFRFSESKR